MSEYLPQGQAELAGCPNMAGLGGSFGLGEPRTSEYRGEDSYARSHPGQLILNSGTPSYDSLYHASRAWKSTGHQNYGRGRLFGLGAFGANLDCQPCGYLGAFDLPSFGDLPLWQKALVAIVAAGGLYWIAKKAKLIKNPRRNARRRRNAPFAVKGVFPTIGAARAAYGAIPAGGYKSLIDMNRRKGRSGKYKTRKIVAQHRLSPGAF